MMMKISIIASFHALGLRCPQPPTYLPNNAHLSYARFHQPALPCHHLPRPDCCPSSEVCSILHPSPSLHSLWTWSSMCVCYTSRQWAPWGQWLIYLCILTGSFSVPRYVSSRTAKGLGRLAFRTVLMVAGINDRSFLKLGEQRSQRVFRPRYCGTL